MKNLVLLSLFFLTSFLSFSQTLNQLDSEGRKQGVWQKMYDNGLLRYKGFFYNNKPKGLFYYYYYSGELQAERNFFHDGEAATVHIFYKNGKLKASGLYSIVYSQDGEYEKELKDSTWNYFNQDSILVMSEQYLKGKLNGLTKTYYKDGQIYESKRWVDNILDGQWIQYFTNGNVQKKSHFLMGKREGEEVSYYIDGSLYYRGMYMNDLKSGGWEYFTKEGVRDTVIYYNNESR